MSDQQQIRELEARVEELEKLLRHTVRDLQRAADVAMDARAVLMSELDEVPA